MALIQLNFAEAGSERLVGLRREENNLTSISYNVTRALALPSYSLGHAVDISSAFGPPLPCKHSLPLQFLYDN